MYKLYQMNTRTHDWDRVGTEDNTTDLFRLIESYIANGYYDFRIVKEDTDN